MAFNALTFIWNGIPSEFYNIYLGYPDSGSSGSGESTTDGSSNSTLLTQKIYRRTLQLLYGVEQATVLSFPLSMYIPNPGLDEQEFGKVSTWLFGQMQYGILRICQNDLQDVFFRCFLIGQKVIRLGNFITGIECTVTCDSPFAWKAPVTNNYSWTNAYNISEIINFYNDTENNYYTYPTKLIITANSFGGDIIITNATDNNRQFILTTSPNEIVTMDCYNQLISSNVTSLPLANFNNLWLRLLKGLNVLTISGNPLSVSMTTERAITMGG